MVKDRKKVLLDEDEVESKTTCSLSAKNSYIRDFDTQVKYRLEQMDTNLKHCVTMLKTAFNLDFTQIPKEVLDMNFHEFQAKKSCSAAADVKIKEMVEALTLNAMNVKNIPSTTKKRATKNTPASNNKIAPPQSRTSRKKSSMQGLTVRRSVRNKTNKYSSLCIDDMIKDFNKVKNTKSKRLTGSSSSDNVLIPSKGVRVNTNKPNSSSIRDAREEEPLYVCSMRGTPIADMSLGINKTALICNNEDDSFQKKVLNLQKNFAELFNL